MHKENKLAINYVFANFSAWFTNILKYPYNNKIKSATNIWTHPQWTLSNMSSTCWTTNSLTHFLLEIKLTLVGSLSFRIYLPILESIWFLMPGHSSGQIIHHDCKFRTKPIKSSSSTIPDDKLASDVLNANCSCFRQQYNIKKKEEIVEQLPQEEPNPLMRKKKTPEELAAEAEQEDLDDFTSKYISGYLSSSVLSPTPCSARALTKATRPLIFPFTRADDDCHNFLCRASSAEQAATFSSMANDFSCLMKT